MKRLLVFAPVLIAGCYSYAPIRASELHPGMGVRVRVRPEAAQAIAPLLGVEDARVLSGTLIENGSSSMIVEVPTVVKAGGGTSAVSLSQRISITPAQLLELESRRLDRTRTALVVGAVALAGGSAAIAAFKGGPGLDHPPTGGSSEAKLPLLRLHF